VIVIEVAINPIIQSRTHYYQSCKLRTRDNLVSKVVTTIIRDNMYEDQNWIALAQNRFQWLAFVNMVIDFRVL
jgi:hypothetical protein